MQRADTANVWLNRRRLLARQQSQLLLWSAKAVCTRPLGDACKCWQLRLIRCNKNLTASLIFNAMRIAILVKQSAPFDARSRF